MPQDVHVRIAAVLHIATGVLFLLALALIGPLVAAFGALGPSYGVDGDLAAIVGGVGILLVTVVALLSVTEIVGAVMLLRGSKAGHAIVLGFSVLSLLNVPIGTVAGIYCLWALLHEPLKSAPATVATPSPAAWQSDATGLS
jgi:hypothetical protein